METEDNSIENMSDTTIEDNTEIENNNGIKESASPMEMEEESEQSCSSNIPKDITKPESTDDVQLKTALISEELIDCRESDKTQSKLISNALQQEDEFLEYLMSLPAASSGTKEKKKSQQKQVQTQPLLMRSISSYGGNVSTGGGAKVGLDHLDNLCKLMEQLGDLREQNSKLQKRVQYLEDLKNLQEMHKQLQEESNRREFQEVAFLRTLQYRQLAAKRQHRRLIDDNFPTPPTMAKREGFEDSVVVSGDNKRNNKCKSMTNDKFRKSLLRYQQRERSRSVGIDEITSDKVTGEKNENDTTEDTRHRNQSSKQMRSIVCTAAGSKAKVSKWTKVKEAFRWEKASVIMLPEAKSQDSGIGGISAGVVSSDDMRYLRVPSGDNKSGDNLLSVSPVDSVISGHSSSACSSGGQSPGYLSCQRPLSDFNLPPTTALSSSSSSEDLDIDLTFTDILAECGPQRSASATDSTGGRLLVQDTRRRSLSLMPEEEDASRRSKSLDGEATIGDSAYIARHFATKDSTNTGAGKHPHQKSHKTPWGKVKDIIQTRKDSLKKRHRYGKSDPGSKTAHSDHEEDGVSCEQRDSPDKEAEYYGNKPSPTRPRIEISCDNNLSRNSTNKRQQSKTSTASLDSHLQASDSPTNRRLTPVLTITLPSTEELRNISPTSNIPTQSSEQAIVRSKSTTSKPPPSPQTEDRHHKFSTASAPATSVSYKNYHGGNGSNELQTVPDDTNSKNDSLKRQVSLPRPTSASTSPPVHRRASKWTKVKKAFLTSSTPCRRDEDGTGRISSSVPSSPNRNSSFFDEMDPDELSSGEYGDINIGKTKQDDGSETDNLLQKDIPSHSTSIHAEIQRNYEELQQKLSQEFHKKLHEWERMKATSTASSSISRGPGAEDGHLHHDKGFRRKMEEWERMKHPQHSQGSGMKHRESVAIQPLDEDNLSPDFRKKLQEWHRIKKSLPVGTTPQSTGEISIPPQFRKKIADWQLWRTGSGKSEGHHRPDDQAEEFNRKQQDWKPGSSSPSPETVTMQPGQECVDRLSGAKTPSPGIVRKESTGHSKGGNKKTAGGSKHPGVVNTTESPGSGKEKFDGITGKTGYAGGKVHQKGKSQKEKELQWLEKELHKIEREKQRLEREREKYLEREARLEKMRRAMGSGTSKQEVLIQTSTGFFRFQGISEKFTRRLYEWEKARGIGPEASTFALLDPGYRANTDSNSAIHDGCSDNVDSNLLSRSKSASSVTNLGTGMTNVGTSSLSLNDVEVLEQSEPGNLEDSRAASEPHLRTTDGPEDDEPAAVIVDVEDVIEETAAPLPVTPAIQSQTPVYSYAPEEVTRLIDSSGSDSDRDSTKLVQRNDSVRTESSYKLLEENMSLLNKLKLKEDICRKLENEIENLEGKIDDVAKTHKKELQRLRREETDLHIQSEEGELIISEEPDNTHEELVADLRARIRELEQRQEHLLLEGETLQDSFAEHSEQQAALAQNLVGKMKQLQEANINMASCDQSQPLQQNSNSQFDNQVEAVALVQDLSTQLLHLAEKLEVALMDRRREVHNLRFELQDRHRKQRKLKSGQHWFSQEGMSVSMGSLAETDVGAEIVGSNMVLPRQSSEELTQLPSLLTNKVLELKEGLNYLCNVSGVMGHQQNSEQESGEVEASATLVLKLDKLIMTTEDDQMQIETESPTTINVDTEGNTSPVTCVTITPAFWKKNETSRESPAQDSNMKNSDEYDRSQVSRIEVSSPNERDSFCSAVSSASATSSVCDDEEDEQEKEGDSFVSEPECQADSKEKESELKQENKEEIVAEETTCESDHDKSSNEDEDNAENCEDTNVRGTIEREGGKINEIVHEDGSDAKYKSTGLSRETSPGYYETEVYTFKVGNKAGKQRKLLKTRRVSDTHVGYKRDTIRQNRQEDTVTYYAKNSEPFKGNKENIEESVSSDACETKTTENNSRNIINKRLRNKSPQDGNSEEERSIPFPNRIGYENTRKNYAQNYSAHKERKSLSEVPYSNKLISEPGNCNPMSTPDNVFVKTTRKIFSPVRRDSKGKASSVISYIVGENSSATHQISQTAEESTISSSPIINVFRRETPPTELIANINNAGKSGSNNISPPVWMFTRARSQSSSPAMTKRKTPTIVDKDSSETISAPDSKSTVGKQNKQHSEGAEPDLSESTGYKAITKPNTDSNEESITRENKQESNEINAPSNLPQKIDAEDRGETFLDKTKSEKHDSPSIPSRPVTPSISFPPLPQSPSPNRRDLFKVVTKETAPSIRMMIAKYNQKLTEQQEGAGGRSPEVCGSGSASPVAWRSPVAERRVRAQMEKYQEEVRRVLQQSSRKVTANSGRNEVQKSASAGVIRAPDTASCIKAEIEANKDNKDYLANKPPSVIGQRRGILKSSSAGSIKPISSVPLTIGPTDTDGDEKMKPAREVEHVKEVAVKLSSQISATKPPSPRLNSSPSPSSPSSPDIGLHHSSPPPSRLRALRLQRAKEEFLTRGPGGRSWTSEAGTPSTDTPSASVSPEPFWGHSSGGVSEKDIIRSVIRTKDSSSTDHSRLSQISMGSESSYDSSVVIAGGVRKKSNVGDDEGMLLVKSASAGMINVDSQAYRKFYEERSTTDQASQSDSQEGKGKSQHCSKFGISSITSKFRKVKMRRNKEKEGGKMNTVSMLCRQSLLVDLHLSKGKIVHGSSENPGPSTSKSCPSSPVLQRTSSGEKPESETSSTPSSWIFNPARKIFKPK